jgi:hypothetical protein
VVVEERGLVGAGEVEHGLRHRGAAAAELVGERGPALDALLFLFFEVCCWICWGCFF